MCAHVYVLIFFLISPVVLHFFLTDVFIYFQLPFLFLNDAHLFELLFLSVSLSVSDHTLRHMRSKSGIIYCETRKESYGQLMSYEDARRHSHSSVFDFNEKSQYETRALSRISLQGYSVDFN